VLVRWFSSSTPGTAPVLFRGSQVQLMFTVVRAMIQLETSRVKHRARAAAKAAQADEGGTKRPKGGAGFQGGGGEVLVLYCILSPREDRMRELGFWPCCLQPQEGRHHARGFLPGAGPTWHSLTFTGFLSAPCYLLRGELLGKKKKGQLTGDVPVILLALATNKTSLPSPKISRS